MIKNFEWYSDKQAGKILAKIATVGQMYQKIFTDLLIVKRLIFPSHLTSLLAMRMRCKL
jgi:hypothetical protein